MLKDLSNQARRMGPRKLLRPSKGAGQRQKGTKLGLNSEPVTSPSANIRVRFTGRGFMSVPLCESRACWVERGLYFEPRPRLRGCLLFCSAISPISYYIRMERSRI